MTIQIYKTPQRSDAGPVTVTKSGDILTVNGVAYDLSDINDPVVRDIPFVSGPIFRQGGKLHVRVIIPYAEGETPVEANDTMPPTPTIVVNTGTPSLFATLGLTIADGALTSVEMAAQLQGAYYEPGYLQVGFATGRVPPNYLVFVQYDVPATMTQYKGEDGFEIIFADTNGDPVNPGRLDIQLLEVR